MLRLKIPPGNPQSALQQGSRSVLAQCSRAYAGLSAEQALGWTALGSTITRTDRVGNTYSLSGIDAFTLVNRWRLYMGLSLALSAIDVEAAPFLSDLTFDFHDDTFDIDWTAPDPTGAGTLMFIQSALVKPSRTIHASDYSFLQQATDPSGGTLSVNAAMTAKYPQFDFTAHEADGWRLGIKITMVSATGWPGIPQSVEGVILSP